MRNLYEDKAYSKTTISNRLIKNRGHIVYEGAVISASLLAQSWSKVDDPSACVGSCMILWLLVTLMHQQTKRFVITLIPNLSSLWPHFFTFKFKVSPLLITNRFSIVLQPTGAPRQNENLLCKFLDNNAPPIPSTRFYVESIILL